MKPSNSSKLLWNEAIRKACNEIMLYDGIIPLKDEREYMAKRIKEKLSYKLNKKLRAIQ